MSSLPAPEPAGGSGLGRASALLASGTLVSRLLGFVSAIILANTLGIKGAGANTFTVANSLPNNVYAIIAGGLLSAILVPQIVRASNHLDGGEKFINRIVTLGFVVFAAIAVIATACAPLLVSLYAQQANDASGRGLSDADFTLATSFAYWCLPQILFYALYSLLGEVLNARKIFGPFTWAPVFNNIVAIAGLVAFNLLFSSSDLADASAWTPGMIALIAGSATLGIAAQAGVLLLFWRRAGLRYRPEFRWRGVGLGKVGKAAGWTFAMILVSQLAGIVQSQVASLAGTDGITWAALRNAWLIFMLPHSIVTVSIVTAYFTRMSGHAHRGDTAALRRDVSSSLRTVGMIMVFATVALVAIAYPFAAVFAKGDFDATSALATVLIAFLVGLIPFTVLFILLRTFYALEDTRTPFFIQLVQAGLFVVGALLVALLPKDQIAIGIAVVTTIAGTVQTIVAAVVLRRRMGGLDGRRVIRSFLIYLLATIPAAIAGVALTAGFGAFDDGYAVSSIFAALLTMAVVGVVMLVLYVGVLAAFRNAELGDFVRPVVRRLRGRG